MFGLVGIFVQKTNPERGWIRRNFRSCERYDAIPKMRKKGRSRNRDGPIKCRTGALMMVHPLTFEIFILTKFYEPTNSSNGHL